MFPTIFVRAASSYHVNVVPTPVAVKSGIVVPKQAFTLDVIGTEVKELIV